MILTTVLMATMCLPLENENDECHEFAIGVWESDSVAGSVQDVKECMRVGKGYYDHLAWECQNKELAERYNKLFGKS